MARQLFGTDGIRGVAGEFPLDARTAFAFGSALGAWAGAHQADPAVVIGMDTRESGQWLAEAVAGGLATQGVRVRFAGVITTPGVAFLTRSDDFVAGVMISASHNPFHDNGLKVFDHSGYKLPDEQEHELEQQIFRLIAGELPVTPLPLAPEDDLDEEYLDFLASTVSTDLAGLRVVLDCAHGAASLLGPKLFRRLGASVTAIGCEPTGRNINDGFGALHTQRLREAVVSSGADAGVAFDGDADRAILVSHSGKVIDGDHILLLIAAALQSREKLPGGMVIATVMSNLGLERALGSLGIAMPRTPVGDKYVLEEMVRRGAALGGEQSGHVIFREHATTGDGMLTALQVLATLRESGRDLDALTASFTVYPQLLVNIKVKERKPLHELASVQDEIRRVERELGEHGRVLVRFSGTEPLARVMVEGPDHGRVEQYAGSIADCIRAELCP